MPLQLVFQPYDARNQEFTDWYRFPEKEPAWDIYRDFEVNIHAVDYDFLQNIRDLKRKHDQMVMELRYQLQQDLAHRA